MKPVDFTTMDLKRVKAYRKSVLNRLTAYEACDCGDGGCDNERERNKDNPRYLFLKQERERVNEELGKRQGEELRAKSKTQSANVPRVGRKGNYFRE